MRDALTVLTMAETERDNLRQQLASARMEIRRLRTVLVEIFETRGRDAEELAACAIEDTSYEDPSAPEPPHGGHYGP